MTTSGAGRRAITLFTLLAASWLLAISIESQEPATVIINGHEAVSREVLVKYRDRTAAGARALLEARAGADESAPLSAGGVRLVRSRTNDTATLIAALKDAPEVEYVEPNYMVYATVVPNDPLFSNLWGLLNTGQDVGGGPGTPSLDIHATAAWNLSTGSASNVVGVIDTGVDYNHPDLAANIWSAPTTFSVTIGGLTIVCGAGTHGFNAITGSCNPMDDNNHGTHVSGTIGAVGNNGIGVAGVNWTARIMGLKFLGVGGSGSTSGAIDAMEFAMQARAAFSSTNGANVRVLSNSWGGGSFSQALLDEINQANTNNMLFVAAAGNASSDNDAQPAYPASYNAPNVMAVAATTNTDALAYFSNYGASSVHLAAPGVNILSTTRNNTYQYFSGTSMATPHVAGAAALLLSRCSLTTASLKSALLGNVDTVPGLSTKTITGGRLNTSFPGCPPELGTLAGQVRNGATDAPVANALINVNPGGFSMSTDANGFFWKTLEPGPYTVSASAKFFLPAVAPSAVVVTSGGTTTHDFALTPNGYNAAIYDSTLKAPRCARGGACDSGTLLVSRANILGGPEPNQPNTILNSCADGNVGMFHTDESIDRIIVSTLDEGGFAPGKTVRIETTVWNYGGDSLDLYYTSNASSPTWKFLTTLTPAPASGRQTLTTTYVLPAGVLQAVRAQFRFIGNPGICSTGAYDDHDDLAFGVGGRSVPGNFDGDGKTDIAVFRPSTGVWYILTSSTNFTSYVSYSFGGPTDVAVPGDYDGDGTTDVAVYRPSTGIWSILTSSSGYTISFDHQWGTGGDIPVVGDYDGDGMADLGVYRPSLGIWYTALSSTSYTTYTATQWGISSDVPAVGDYDGDGKADLGVYRPSSGMWYINLSSTNYTSYLAIQWGVATDRVVPGDYDGDTKTDLGIYRPATGVWYILQSATNYTTYVAYQWGISTDIVVPGDYDGDRRTDLGVYRPATGIWYILKSTANYTTFIQEQWGVSTDIPVLEP
jgi:subtilisin family serine protease